MADPNKPLTPQEPRMERRMLVAFILMGAVFFLMPYFYKTFFPQAARPAPAGPKRVETPAAPKPAEAAPAAAAAPRTEAAPSGKLEPGSKAPAAQVAGQKEESFVVDTELYRVVLSNRGAVVKSWVLKKYLNTAGKKMELVNGSAAQTAGYPFSLIFKEKGPTFDASDVLYSATPSPDNLGITYQYSDGKSVVRKTFEFQKDRYMVRFSSEATTAGAGLQHLATWRGGFGDYAVFNPAAEQHTVHYDLAAGKLIVKSSKDAKNGPVVDYGTYSFAGIEDKYFAAVFLPADRAAVEFRTLSDTVTDPSTKKEQPLVGEAVGGASQNHFSVFVGPKDIDILKKVDPKLEQIVDFGTWFGWLAKPLFLMLNWLNNDFVHNYGWAIVLATVFINFALLPLKFTSMKSMKKMQALQPQIQTINAKYKNISMRDPRKAEQNQEVMALYKKHGVNPMGGCLPMLLQVPFFIAFYTVLSVSIQMRGASWLWVSDLSQPETLPIRILPIAMIVSQFVMQKMTPSTTGDPAQQKMMLFMPLVFGFMFYQFASGLVLYWLTSNLVGVAQQWFINKTSPPAPGAVVVEQPKRKR